jgi:hypothetical protein
VVPLDFLVVQVFDVYEFERFAVPRAGRVGFLAGQPVSGTDRRTDAPRTRSTRRSPPARGGPGSSM